MQLTSKARSGGYFSVLSALMLGIAALSSAQTSKPAQKYPTHLPYSFGNLVWWSDEELRTVLKNRIPGLGDEIAVTPAAEGRMRNALTALLKEKGIVAEVQSEEPSPSSFGPPMEKMLGMGDLEIPPFRPTIIFSVLRPTVILGKVTVQSDVEDLRGAIEGEFKADEGRPFTGGMMSFSQSRAEAIVKRGGYLKESVIFRRAEPYKHGDAYAIDVTVVVNAGPMYRVSSLHADGGPMFEGKDLMQFVQGKVGDTAGGSPFRGLGPQLKAYYQQNGFADVLLKVEQSVDTEHATVAYSLTVIPGPVYHLESLTIERLLPEQENKVRELLGMKPGDIYREDAIHGLYRKIADEPLLKGYSFGYAPKANKEKAVVDLSLDFSKEGGAATVTVK